MVLDENKQPSAAVFNLSSPTPGKPKTKLSLKKKLVIVLGILVAVFIVLFMIVALATSAPVSISNNLVQDIQSDNTAAAYSLMSREAKAVTGESNFNEIVNRISPILSGKPSMQSKEIKGETGSSATAKVVYKIHGTDGIDYTFTVNLTKENGDWKVLNFESKK